MSKADRYEHLGDIQTEEPETETQTISENISTTQDRVSSETLAELKEENEQRATIFGAIVLSSLRFQRSMVSSSVKTALILWRGFSP